MVYATVAIIVGAGVVTGLLFAFSNFVMQALSTMEDKEEMFAMQQINEKIINPIFLTFFLGTPLLCVLVIGSYLITGVDSPNVFLLVGCILYLVGPFGITMLFNVPLNNRLAKAGNEDAHEVWPDYQHRWQRWNHLRTYVGIISILFLATGLVDLNF